MRWTAPLLLSAAIAACFGLETQAGDEHHTVVPGDAVTWGPAPPSLPPGAQAAILFGSPAKEGPFVLRLKFPANYMVPPHRHSKEEHVTVISGTFGMGTGEKLDRDAAPVLPTASFVRIPVGMAHYAWTDEEAVIQINGIGPFDVVYVNPADDPRKAN